jgi:aminoglycoside/choline kinase family phosphotransferase
MTKSPSSGLPPAAKTQVDRFMETARALGADEDEAAFKAKLGVIARQKPREEIAPVRPPKGKEK